MNIIKNDFVWCKENNRLGKEYVKAVYCHSAYLTYIQSTS